MSRRPAAGGVPPIVTVPTAAGTSPAMTLSNVVFPQPLAPIRAKNSPRRTASSTPDRALRAWPKLTARPRTAMSVEVVISLVRAAEAFPCRVGDHVAPRLGGAKLLVVDQQLGPCIDGPGRDLRAEGRQQSLDHRR